MIGSLVIRKMGCSGLLLACLLVAVLHAPSQTVPAQTTSTPAGTSKSLSYEVVSIRPAKPSNGMSWGSTDNSFSASGISTRLLIKDAYGVITDDQLSGLPGWAGTQQYDFQAKMDAETSAAFKKLSQEERRVQFEQMLQTMLAERFNLKIRRETKEIPVYALVVAKGGSKLKETPASTPMGYGTSGGPDGSTLKGHGVTIESLIYSLSGAVGRIIVDKTGLTGKYEMDLKWSSQDNPASGDTAPSIFTALQEQLGIKLESAKAPVETFVVEHIDKPSEN